MDQIAWLILHVLDSVTFGWVSRWGTRYGGLPDPSAVWHEERGRLDRGRVEGEALVGRTGAAVTPLRPAGRIALGRCTYEAMSEAVFIDAGMTVEVVGRTGFALVVRERPA